MKIDTKKFLVANALNIGVVAALVAIAIVLDDEGGNRDATRGLLVAAGVVAGINPGVAVLTLAALAAYVVALEVEGGESKGLGSDRVRTLAVWGALPLVCVLLVSQSVLLSYIQTCLPVVGPRVARAVEAAKAGLKRVVRASAGGAKGAKGAKGKKGSFAV